MTEDLWAELRARRAHLDARIQAAPIVVIEGVAGPNGVTAGKVGGEKLWHLRLTLQLWREAGGSLQRSCLTLKRQVDDENLKLYQLAVKPYCQVRLRARLVTDSDLSGSEGLIEEFPQAFEDRELAERAGQLQVPVTYQDELFGTCTLNKRINGFDANAQWEGSEIRVHLRAETPDALPAVLKQAYALWKDSASWHARVLDQAVADLLKLKNNTWLHEDEKSVTANEFKQRLSFQSVNIDEYAAFEFYLTDGDLFWGHVIVVQGTLEQGPTGANIAG